MGLSVFRPETLELHDEWRLILITLFFGAACAAGTSGALLWMQPEWAQGLAALATVGCLILGLGRHLACQLILALLWGMVISLYRMEHGPTGVLERETFTRMTGVVDAVENRLDRPLRLTLKPLAAKPSLTDVHFVRLIVRTSYPGDIVPGDTVALDAILSAPKGPAVPDGYDFARNAFYAGIGAEGFSASAIRRLDAVPQDGFGIRLRRLRRLREALAADIMKAMPGQEGALAAALSVGIRDYITADTATALRNAGLSHLLAISGLHMGLVTAAAFFFLEYLFAAFPGIALRVRPKKIAAWGAWMFALAYLALSGASVATLRAFIMVSVALLAVLLDRRVLSLRSVAIAALLILLFQPEAVLSIGFQMSFAATSALVAIYEYASRFHGFQTGDRGVISRALLYVGVTAFTSLVAQIAVAPFALYHFQSVSVIGVVANIVVVPIVSLAVMPILIVAMLAQVIGLLGPVSMLLEPLLSLILGFAHYFGDKSFALYRAGAPDSLFIAGITIAFVGILMLRGRWVVAPAVLALLSALWGWHGRQADVLIDNGGRVVALHLPTTGRMAVTGGRRGGFRDTAWAQYWGVDPTVPPLPLTSACDRDACRTKLGQQTYINRVKTQEGLRQACAAGEIVIAPRRWRRYCKGAAILLTQEDITQKGPVAVYLERTDEVLSVRIAWSRPESQVPWNPPVKTRR